MSCVPYSATPERRRAAPADKQRAIAQLVRDLGVSGAARFLGIGRDSTRRLARGELVTLATLQLALMRLS